MTGGALNVHRPRLAWIKRRARRIMAAYGTQRRLAIWDAWSDYVTWTHDPRPVPRHLRLVAEGVRHG